MEEDWVSVAEQHHSASTDRSQQTFDTGEDSGRRHLMDKNTFTNHKLPYHRLAASAAFTKHQALFDTNVGPRIWPYFLSLSLCAV